MNQKLYKVFEVELSFFEYSSTTYYVSGESIQDVLDLFKQHLKDENTSEDYPIYITDKVYDQLTYKKNWTQHFKEMPDMFSDKRHKVWYGHCY